MRGMQEDAAGFTNWSPARVASAAAVQARSVLLLENLQREAKGTGFILDRIGVITCHHVIEGGDPRSLVGTLPDGSRVPFSEVRSDPELDLALLNPSRMLNGGLSLGKSGSLQIGTPLRTWGHPLGYGGPAPLLSTGYLAGITESSGGRGGGGRLIVNAAFNKGNSGGPLFVGDGAEVVGVVVTKHTPMTPWIHSAIQALSANHSGLVFEAKMVDGTTRRLAESQIVADVLEFYRQLSQYMIGEAIPSEEVAGFVNRST